MDAQVKTPPDRSIGDLFGELMDDGRSLARAETELYKQIALYRAGKAKNGLIAFAAGGLLAFAGLIACLVGLVMGLANLIGPVAGGLVVLAATGIIGFMLFRYGAGKMASLSGDADEKAALAAGERMG